MKIFTKLLLIMLVMTSLLFTCLYFLLQWTFDEGLLEYVNKKEVESLSQVTNNIKKVYAEVGDLQAFKENEKWWHTVLQKSSLNEELSSTDVQSMISEKPHFHRNSARNNRPPPPRGAERRGPPHLANNRFHERPQPREFSPHSMVGNDNTISSSILDKRPSLLSPDKSSIIGRYDHNFSTLAITFNEKVIGYVALPPKQQLTSPFDIAFSASQRTTWFSILFVLFIVTLIMVTLLSRYIVKRVHTLANATNQLAKGDLNITLPVNGKDELAVLARDFNDLAKTLAHNDTSRKTWLADVSHELRTPLAIVKGEIEALQDGIRPVNAENLQSLSDEVDHLHKLIDDLNQLSNADIGAFSYQKSPHNILIFLKQSIQHQKLLAEEAGLQLTCQLPNSPLNAWIDETRIYQLFNNLFTNALKYTDAPGLIHVTAYQEKNNMIITFEDSSPSVPIDVIDKLFNHLFRVESSRNRKTGGFGLGLTLCKKIVEAHQGDISAYQSSQGGLGIKISIPLL